MEGFVICVKGTYIVVRFKILRAADGGESRVPAAELAGLPWIGTSAASVADAEHTITTMDNLERARIIKCVSANVGLGECGRSRFWSARVDFNTAATYVTN